MASATAPPSMMAPSTMLSGGIGSLPKAVTLNALPVGFSSTALTALDPMSSPTTALLLPRPNTGSVLCVAREDTPSAEASCRRGSTRASPNCRLRRSANRGRRDATVRKGSTSQNPARFQVQSECTGEKSAIRQRQRARAVDLRIRHAITGLGMRRLDELGRGHVRRRPATKRVDLGRAFRSSRRRRIACSAPEPMLDSAQKRSYALGLPLLAPPRLVRGAGAAAGTRPGYPTTGFRRARARRGFRRREGAGSRAARMAARDRAGPDNDSGETRRENVNVHGDGAARPPRASTGTSSMPTTRCSGGLRPMPRACCRASTSRPIRRSSTPAITSSSSTPPRSS